MTQNAGSGNTQDKARYIEEEIKKFVRSSPLNRMPDTSGQVIFDEPLVRFASGDDILFNQYKTIIAQSHLTPREALAIALNRKTGRLPCPACGDKLDSTYHCEHT